MLYGKLIVLNGADHIIIFDWRVSAKISDTTELYGMLMLTFDITAAPCHDGP